MMSNAQMKTTVPSTRYGVTTRMVSDARYASYLPAALNALTCAGFSSTPEKMKIVPTSTPETAPRGLKACEKFRRRSEVFGSPKSAIKEFAPVSRNAAPLAITNKATRKKL